MIRSLLISTICFAAVAARAEIREPELSGGRHAVVDFELRDPSQPWVVFAPGSNCNLYDVESSVPFQALVSQRAFNILIINKAGIDNDGSCRTEEFNRSADRETRVADIQFLVAQELPKGVKTIIYAGESEGGYIIPEIANEDSRTKAIILFSGGTRNWIDEEVEKTPEAERADVRLKMDTEVIPNPTYDHFFRGWTYSQLDSYNSNKSYDELAKTKVPVLMLNGDKDTCTWVDATTADVRAMKKPNITLKLFNNADHGLRCASGTDCQEAFLDRGLEDAVTQFVKTI